MKQTTLCYIQKDNQYLMLHRTKKENDINRDKWIGIGGKLEEGETPQQCLMREVKEETGLTLLSCNYRGIVRFIPDTDEPEDMHLFTSDEFEGELITCDEGELEWIDIDKLYKLTLWEGDKIFLALLKADAKFFNLSLEYIGDKLVSASIDGKLIF